MNGAHDVFISAGKMQYELHIQRNITIIRGDSSTGKTNLITLLQRARNPQDIGVHVKCDVPVLAVIPTDDWQQKLKETENSIIFLDEDCSFVATQRFASLALHSTNYFVIISRYDFPMLPYSVSEIYSLRDMNRNKYPQTKQVCNELCPYSCHIPQSVEHSQIFITEDNDSKSV